MTTVSLGRSTPYRWRAHAALGTAAAAMVGVATVVVGAQLIGVTPPKKKKKKILPRGIPVPAARRDPLVPYGPDPLVPYGMRDVEPRTPSGPVSGSYTGGCRLTRWPYWAPA